MRALALSLLVPSLLACSSAPPPEPAPPLPTPAPTQTAQASAQPSASEAAAQPPAPNSPFVGAGEIPAPSRLFAVDGALFVAGQTATVFNEGKEDERRAYRVGMVREGKLDFPKNMEIEGWFHRIDEIQGKWPEGVDMLALTDTGRVGMAEHFVLTSKGWEQKRGFCHTSPSAEPWCEGGTRFLGLQMVGGSLVALEAPQLFGDAKFTTLRGPAVKRKLSPLRSCKPEERFGSKVEVRPRAFGSLKDGSLVSFGVGCDGKQLIESWKPDGGEPTLTELKVSSEASDEVDRFVRGAQGDAWLLAGWIARYDGSGWKEVAAPDNAQVTVGAVAPDGSLWIVAGGKVYRRNADAWESVPLPAGIAEANDLTTHDGQVWASAGAALLRTRKPGESGEGVPIRTAALPTPPPPKPRLARPGGPRCASNLVILYGFTKTTPDDYDFPLTRKAVKGHNEFKDTRFAVTRDGGKKFFSALVPSFEAGQKLVKLIEKEVKNSKPQLVCAEPEIVRELKIDLKTGQVQK